MSGDNRMSVRARLDQAPAYVRAAEPRVPLSRRAIVTDILIAALALVVSLLLQKSADHSGTMILPGGVVTKTALSLDQLWKHSAAAILLTSVPLAFRRRFPLTAFAVLLVGALATRQYATDVTFLAIVFAGYSAVAYSRFRNAAMLSMPVAGLLVVYAFWTAAPAGNYSVTHVSAGALGPSSPLAPRPGSLPGYDAGTPAYTVQAAAPWRLTGLVVAAALVLIAVVANAVRARDRLRRLQAEHEAATRRALEQERAHIASELHDVVTHNVSVMIVQAGAARQVLSDSPDEAREALLAVESSGRAAMTELRHLLGLLGQPGEDTDGTGSGEKDLRPQPGLGQLRPLIDRVAAAGLPVELRVGGVPRELPPGQDLAAFRVVQEALTNVIKHAGKPPTTVTLDYRADDLVVEVADAGRPFPAAGPATVGPGSGRGLLGLRERMTLYGGDLVAGPRPGGGWLVRARMPIDPPPSAPGPAPAGLAAEPATRLASPAAGTT